MRYGAPTICVVTLILFLGCKERGAPVSARPAQPISASVAGLNQYAVLPTLELLTESDAAALFDFFEGIDGETSAGPSVDYNEKYRIVFTLKDGGTVTVVTLYNDRNWHFEGRTGDRPIRKGLTEFLAPRFEKQLATAPSEE